MTEENSDIPQWQKDLLDERLKAIEEHLELVKPIEELIKILYDDVD